jgi:hypothetical protein
MQKFKRRLKEEPLIPLGVPIPLTQRNKKVRKSNGFSFVQAAPQHATPSSAPTAPARPRTRSK